jgi:Leucine-rich repeat (LRR) protein
MNISETIQDDKKKQSQGNYKLLTITGVLLFLAIFLFISKADFQTKSDKVIRTAAAHSLKKDPNDFGRNDYAKVTSLDLSGKEVSDIRYIGKFKNLKSLRIGDLIIPELETPKWKTALQRLHIIKLKPQEKMVLFINPNFNHTKQISSLQNISQDNLIDLNPLKKLKNLQFLSLSNTMSLKNVFDTGFKQSGKIFISRNPESIINPETFVNTIPFKNINPISSLTSLKSLSLGSTLISDLTPLKDLKNLQSLYLSETDVNDLEPTKNLKFLTTLFLSNTKIENLDPISELEKLESLYIGGTQVTSLEPLKSLSNLRELEIDRTKVSDLEPIMGLKNLMDLWMYQCENITDEQVEDLQHALPNLKIYRHLNSKN